MGIYDWLEDPKLIEEDALYKLYVKVLDGCEYNKELFNNWFLNYPHSTSDLHDYDLENLLRYLNINIDYNTLMFKFKGTDKFYASKTIEDQRTGYLIKT